MAFMKTLLLLRHAKSSVIEPTLSDSMRPLTYQGKQDVYIIGNLLKNNKLIPDIIICSNAKRAVDTSKLIAEYVNYHNEIHLSKLLYQTTAKDYINVVSETPDKNNMVLLVGHNPILENLVEIITNESRIMKTCSLAHIVLPIKKWLEIKIQTKGKLIEIFDIKSLE